MEVFMCEISRSNSGIRTVRWENFRYSGFVRY